MKTWTGHSLRSVADATPLSKSSRAEASIGVDSLWGPIVISHIYLNSSD